MNAKTVPVKTVEAVPIWWEVTDATAVEDLLANIAIKVRQRFVSG